MLFLLFDGKFEPDQIVVRQMLELTLIVHFAMYTVQL